MSDDATISYVIECDASAIAALLTSLRNNPPPHPSGDGRMPMLAAKVAILEPDRRWRIWLEYPRPAPPLGDLAERWLDGFDPQDQREFFMALQEKGYACGTEDGPRFNLARDERRPALGFRAVVRKGSPFTIEIT